MMKFESEVVVGTLPSLKILEESDVTLSSSLSEDDVVSETRRWIVRDRKLCQFVGFQLDWIHRFWFPIFLHF